MEPGITSERFVRQLHARLLYERGQVELAQRESRICWSSAVRTTRRSAVRSPRARLHACFSAVTSSKPGKSSTTGSAWVRNAIRYASMLFIRGLDIEEAAIERGAHPTRSSERRRLLAHLEDLRSAQVGAAPLVDARLATARATAARILGGDALAAAAEAVQRWETLGMLPGLAAALVGSARAHLAVGDRPGAAQDLRRARDLTEQMGASLRREEIDSLATRAGLHLGQEPADRGDGLLTPREREVLGLLVEGSTNRQIAERLFISEKTASVHVSNIMAKLGVPNRGQAVVAAKGRGLV